MSISSVVPSHTGYWTHLLEEIKDLDTIHITGRVTAVKGDLIYAKHIHPTIGTECYIGEQEIPGEVISVNENECVLTALETTKSINIKDKVVMAEHTDVGVCNSLLGRVIDGFGRAIDGKGMVRCLYRHSLYAQPPPLLQRPLITEQLYTRIKTIDMFTPIGKGQRIGVFSGSGVGKSTLLGMIAQHSMADVNVVALVGERGREVKELIEYDIGLEGMKNTVVIAVSSDESPSVRLRAVFYACAIAEFFRGQGQDVTLLIDSLTRVAHAQREIGIMRGEVPVARGYPTSIYRVLPQIVERCGTTTTGSITGIFTVLVEGDDEEEEPVADIVRGIVDGHIILRRELAQQMQYPAVHISTSLSRVASRVQSKAVFRAINTIRERLGLYEQSKDVINAGVYTAGANRDLDAFLNLKREFDQYLKQGISESSDIKEVENYFIEFSQRL